MSLRWRFTLLVTGLLGAVLIALGMWIARNEHVLALQTIAEELSGVPHTPGQLQVIPRGEGPEQAGFGMGDWDGEPLRLPDLLTRHETPIQVEWFIRHRRVAYARSTGDRVETEVPGSAPPGPPGRAPRMHQQDYAGRTYFVTERTLGEQYSPDDEGGLRRGAGKPGPGGRRERPAGPRGPRRPGRGPGRGPPRPAPTPQYDVQVTQRVMVEAEPMLVAVGYTQRLRSLILTCLAAMGIGGLCAWVVSGAMVRPIGRAASAAEGIRTLRQRLPELGSTDELGRLVTILNGMLGRLEEGADRERNFLGTASHELRRPLAALTAELELSQRGERDAVDLKRAITLALGDARNMAHLVDDLLAHARARAGSLTMVEREVDLVELVVESVSRCGRIVGEDATLIVGEIPEAVLRGDGDALGRIVENLVINAATHGGEGVTVTVRAEASKQGARIHVEDDGPGIPQHELTRIFDAFGRGDTARSRPGSGLGLAIVRDLVEAHEGDIAVTSPLQENGAERGTRFSVTLPGDRVLRAP